MILGQSFGTGKVGSHIKITQPLVITVAAAAADAAADAAAAAVAAAAAAADQ